MADANLVKAKATIMKLFFEYDITEGMILLRKLVEKEVPNYSIHEAAAKELAAEGYLSSAISRDGEPGYRLTGTGAGVAWSGQWKNWA